MFTIEVYLILMIKKERYYKKDCISKRKEKEIIILEFFILIEKLQVSNSVFNIFLQFKLVFKWLLKSIKVKNKKKTN